MDVRFEVGNLVGDGGGERKARVSITAKFEHALDDIIVPPDSRGRRGQSWLTCKPRFYGEGSAE